MGTSTKTATFSITEAEVTSTSPVGPADPESLLPAAAPTETPVGFFELPKVGQYKTAGIWMYFDQATSSVANFFLAHCLPGVNYTHAGGTSSLDIAIDGTLSGACALSYNQNTWRFTGTLTKGKWFEDGTVIFTLETQVVLESNNNDESGTSTYSNTWRVEGKFTSALQVSGTANGSGTCSTSNPSVAPCITPNHGSYVEASGTVPFVINFNPSIDRPAGILAFLLTST